MNQDTWNTLTTKIGESEQLQTQVDQLQDPRSSQLRGEIEELAGTLQDELSQYRASRTQPTHSRPPRRDQPGRVKRPRVLALFGDETGCVLWRVWSPYAALERRGYGAWFRHKDDPETYKPEFAYLAATRLEAIVIPRMFWRDQLVARRWISSLHRAGLAVIYELDDDVLTPQIGARQRATTETDKTLDDLEQDRRDRIAAIRLCDGVTVSNDRLAAVVRTYVAPHTPVLTVPNRIDVRWFRSCVRGVRRDVPPLTVGWAGGARYAEDLEPLAEAWHNLARRYPDRHLCRSGVHGRCAGAGSAGCSGTSPPLASARRVPARASQHRHRLRQRGRQPLQSLQNADQALGIHARGRGLGRQPDTLRRRVHDGEDCLIAETASEWEAALARLIESCELRKRLWRAQRRTIAEHHSLERHVLEWPKAWAQIIDEFKSRDERWRRMKDYRCPNCGQGAVQGRGQRARADRCAGPAATRFAACRLNRKPRTVQTTRK